MEKALVMCIPVVITVVITCGNKEEGDILAVTCLEVHEEVTSWYLRISDNLCNLLQTALYDKLVIRDFVTDVN